MFHVWLRLIWPVPASAAVTLAWKARPEGRREGRRAVGDRADNETALPRRRDHHPDYTRFQLAEILLGVVCRQSVHITFLQTMRN